MSKRVGNDNERRHLKVVDTPIEWATREAALIADMMQAAAQRGYEAKHEERAYVLSFCKKHPDMRLEVAAKFFACGEHIK